MISDLSLAYAAGLFDGEGHICISYRSGAKGKAKYPRYQLYVSMSQNNKAAVLWMKQVFGGSARCVTGKRSYDAGQYRRWNWVLSTAAAADFLRLISKYSIVKGREIDIALAFQATMDAHRSGKVSLDIIEFRQECFQRIRQIRGTKAA